MEQTHRNRISQQCEQRGVLLTAAQLDQLARYVEFLLRWRRHFNLTGLREAARMIDVLVAESLDFFRRDLLPPAARVLDLGTGAGVPGVPLAICAPDLRLTLLDRSQKKTTFLRHIVPALHLQNCQIHCSSAEELARHLLPSQRFAAVVARGVGSVACLLSLAAPLLCPGGKLVLRKPQGTPELQEAQPLLASDVWTDCTVLPLSWYDPAPWVLVVSCRALGDTAGENA